MSPQNGGGLLHKRKGCKIKILDIPPSKEKILPKAKLCHGFGWWWRWVTHLGRLASPGGGGVAMEVGAEGAEEAHRVHGPAANLCV